MIEYSFVIPVYNRPNEVKELLDSFLEVKFNRNYEIVIVEDGSTQSSEYLIKEYASRLNISYMYKENSGPGDSRNYGMQHAKGNYFIILDSDVILPPDYLQKVDGFLSNKYVDVFGGPDAAHESFSDLQKAINFAMTSFLTTGGIRGGKKSIGKFQPRSFNMGISKKAFEATSGYGLIHPGEDPDLTFRLWEKGFESELIKDAKVFHKRRISWANFRKQVYKFGIVRPILSKRFNNGKLTFWFPSLFSLFVIASILISYFTLIPLALSGFYFAAVALLSTYENKSLKIGIMSVWAVAIQFFSYGFAFLKSNYRLNILQMDELEAFPDFFFKKK